MVLDSCKPKSGPYWKRAWVVTGVLALSATAILTVPLTSAQVTDPVPSNPNILTAIQSLRADIATAFNQVFQSLQSIQASLKNLTPAPVGNVLNTPLLNLPGFSPTQNIDYECTASNVSSASRTVLIEMFDAGGNLTATSSLVISPGFTAVVGSPTNSVIFSARCRFTVQAPGTRTDITGAVIRNIQSLQTAALTDSTALPAQ